MLSRICQQRIEVLVPKLKNQFGGVLSGDATIIDLSTAENWLLMEELRKGIPRSFDNVSNADLTYPEGFGGSLGARKRFTALFNNYFHPRIPVEPSQVTLSAGASFALNALVQQICDPGDGILLAAPYWPGLDLCITVHNEAIAVPVHVPLESFFDVSSIQYYEDALKNSSAPIRGVLVCNPHNPLGRNYPRETLQAMLDFCSRNKLHYISDEVYAMSQHDSTTLTSNKNGFVSALSLDGGDGLVHVVYTVSKDFGCSGIRMGAYISQTNESLHISSALSTLSQTSTMAALVAEKAILSEHNLNFVTIQGAEMLKTTCKLVTDFLSEREVPFVPAECGLFVFARFSNSGDTDVEKEFQLCLRSHHVALLSGTGCHFGQPGWFRVCYSVPPEKLSEGLKRLDKALADHRKLHIK